MSPFLYPIATSLIASTCLAGTLEPPSDAVDEMGNPKATGATPPAWDKLLPADDTGDPCNSSRFTCVLGGAAVRDNTTGLVWELTARVLPVTWAEARLICPGQPVGDVRGWRLPSVHELASLLDPTQAAGDRLLPPGHPFQNVLTAYWSATTDAADPAAGWIVNFGNGLVGTADKSGPGFVWCVRGGLHHGAQY